MPALYVAVAIAAWNIANLGDRGAEVGGVDQAVGETLRESAEASSGGRGGAGAETLARDLVDRRVYDKRTVIGEKIFAARAIEQHPTDPVRGADDGFGADLIGETYARRPVIGIGMDQGAIIETAVLGENQRVGFRIEVGQLIVAHVLRRSELVAQTEI